MKSLVEEASSITKAIEKAWTRAGKLQTFSVKILKIPKWDSSVLQKKICQGWYFFEEADVEKSEASSINTHNKPHHTTTDRTPSKKRSSEKNSIANLDAILTLDQHNTPLLRKSTTETTQNQTPSTQENASPRQERRDYKKTFS